MPLPGEAEDVSRNFIAGDLNGRLCVINSCDEERDDIWVMNEYGVASSWTRIRFRFLFRCMRPMCSSNNSDEVLLEFDKEMVYCTISELTHGGICEFAGQTSVEGSRLIRT
ncbi:unnamed protein product [Brassica rapa subsp. trilocularis]